MFFHSSVSPCVCVGAESVAVSHCGKPAEAQRSHPEAGVLPQPPRIPRAAICAAQAQIQRRVVHAQTGNRNSRSVRFIFFLSSSGPKSHHLGFVPCSFLQEISHFLSVDSCDSLPLTRLEGVKELSRQLHDNKAQIRELLKESHGNVTLNQLQWSPLMF